MPRLPTYFLSHGGGPWPWLKAERPGLYDQLEGSLHAVRRELGEAPRAVLMISGHWEASRFLVSSAARPHKGRKFVRCEAVAHAHRSNLEQQGTCCPVTDRSHRNRCNVLRNCRSLHREHSAAN